MTVVYLWIIPFGPIIYRLKQNRDSVVQSRLWVDTSPDLINRIASNCISQLLNLMCNLIVSSNKLFEEPYFHHVEKIKTIGSCYMAASGLAPDKQVGDFSVCGLISFCLISFALICGTCYDIISLHETVCLSLSPPEIDG